jgi:hypothetical protein
LIDKNKRYRTKGDVLHAKPVTILTTEARGVLPVVGLVHIVGDDLVLKWSDNGVAFPPVESYLDLVEITKDEWDAMIEAIK